MKSLTETTRPPWLHAGLPLAVASKIAGTNDRGCWLWRAAKTDKGYGVYCLKGKMWKAHRLVYTFIKGPIRSGMCLLHACDGPACVNPDHLTPGTKAENNADMLRKGRHIAGGTKTPLGVAKYERGESHHAARLTVETVRALRADRSAGLPFSVLANKYGIAIGHVFRIVKRKAWAHV